ncbi:hypothetical protein, partial [Desulfovibrio piger]|uniref:hypothetical protein n=2 Tax=Desulfovibrio TaxID=872 RepID=UPI003F06F834
GVSVTLRAASIGEAAFLFLAARSGNAGRGVALRGQARPPKQEKTCMTTKSVKSDTRLDTVKRTVTLRGLTPIMFDRYAGDNTTKLEWSQKIYLIPGTNVLCLPAANISSFLSAHNTTSAPKRLRDARQFKKICNACLSFTMIEGIDSNPQYIPFTRHGKKIEVGKFSDDSEPKSGLYLDRRVARLEKGIPNPKERPVLPLPWELTFSLTIFPNKEIKEQEIQNLFAEGGLAIGLGTFRGMFGKFEIEAWK